MDRAPRISVRAIVTVPLSTIAEALGAGGRPALALQCAREHSLLRTGRLGLENVRTLAQAVCRMHMLASSPPKEQQTMEPRQSSSDAHASA